jgi:hypothetical protein
MGHDRSLAGMVTGGLRPCDAGRHSAVMSARAWRGGAPGEVHSQEVSAKATRGLPTAISTPEGWASWSSSVTEYPLSAPMN